jgi:hypothetical protein
MRTLLSFLFIITLAINISAQEDQHAEMMRAWEAYMTPGPAHELLATSVGTWKSEITTWMDPSQPPVISEGITECESILGGRYFRSIHKMDFMDMPTEGIEISGYDNATGKYFFTWIDNMGTGIMYVEGTMDEDGRTITYTGTTNDPMGNPMKVRWVSKHIDKDNMFFEMFMDQDGNEVKSMEIRSTRVL